MSKRPRYETDNDVVEEARAFLVFQEYLKSDGVICEGRKLPEARYHVDFAVVDAGDSVRGWVEVKCRQGSPKRYPTWYISYSKVCKGLELAHHSGRPFYLIFRWDNEVFVTEIEEGKPLDIQWNGRVDRGDPQDKEPVVHFPSSMFDKIGVVKTDEP